MICSLHLFEIVEGEEEMRKKRKKRETKIT
jgi:hypothetical protein